MSTRTPPLLVTELRAELAKWQERYHELALRCAERSSPPIAVAPAEPSDPRWAMPMLPVAVMEAIESRTIPFSPERATALTYARDALAVNMPEEVVVKTVLAGEVVDV